MLACWANSLLPQLLVWHDKVGCLTTDPVVLRFCSLQDLPIVTSQNWLIFINRKARPYAIANVIFKTYHFVIFKLNYVRAWLQNGDYTFIPKYRKF